MMSSKCFLFIFVGIFLHVRASDILKATTPDAPEILQKFINLVQTHQLNVSVIVSKNAYGPDGQLVKVTDNALLFPSSKIHATQPQLNQQVRKQWIEDMKALDKGLGIATYKTVSVKNGFVSQNVVKSTNVQHIPNTPSYEGITTVENGIQGYSPKVPNWQIKYNFEVPTEDGDLLNVQIIGTHLNLKLLTQTGSITANEMKTFKELILKAWLEFGSSTRYIAANIQKELAQLLFPESKWIVNIGTEKLYVDATKSVTFFLFNNYIIIFQ